MRVLIVGGSGYVGGLIAPVLGRDHELRILDLRPPAAGGEFFRADATDFAALSAAMTGVDAVVHCAMGAEVGTEAEMAAAAFDVNLKSVHLTLLAANEAGVRHAVHVSSLSVFDKLTGRRVDETTTPDATDRYGLTKRLGEEVCRAAVTEYGMSVTVLRFAWPTPDDTWPAWGRVQPPVRWKADDGTPIHGTAATDAARAVAAALEFRDGFQIFTITGDDSARLWSTEKARRLLNWAPTFGAGRDDHVR
ncbi:MAG TPA: NAD(P)-dependent oxidoreductase [Pilimelia sp.]|nr:NAD(P)-dependent oxidoreductase [Pilimelia sp.]